MPKELKTYAEWLAGYMANAMMPTHYYDYPFCSAMILGQDAEIPALYGAKSISIIIVPKGIKATPSDKGIGHGHLYFMDGFKQLGGWVPLYPDVYDLLPVDCQVRARKFIEKEEEEARQWQMRRREMEAEMDIAEKDRQSLLRKAL